MKTTFKTPEVMHRIQTTSQPNVIEIRLINATNGLTPIVVDLNTKTATVNETPCSTFEQLKSALKTGNEDSRKDSLWWCDINGNIKSNLWEVCNDYLIPQNIIN